MIIEILSHIPRWVFALFFGLIYLGYIQSKVREVSLARLVILPVAMLGLSFSGVYNTFDASALSLGFWFGAFAIGITTVLMLGDVKQVRYSAATQSFTVPGSWLPLALLMAIFFTKFAVGMLLSQHRELLAQTNFVAGTSVAYGIFSGVFFGRMLKIMSVHGKQVIRTTLAA